MSEINVRKMEELFVAMVHNNPCVWQKCHTDYRNNQAKDKAWFNIAKLVNLDAKTAKEKFRLMRQKYIREKLKLQNSVVGAYKTKPWHAMEKMSFLDNMIKSRKPFFTNCLVNIEANASITQDPLSCIIKEENEESMDNTHFLTIDVNEPASTSASLPTSPKITPQLLTFGIMPQNVVSTSSSNFDSSHTSPTYSVTSPRLTNEDHSQNPASFTEEFNYEKSKQKMDQDYVNSQVQREEILKWGRNFSGRTSTFCSFIATRLEEIPINKRSKLELDIISLLNKYSEDD